MPINDFRPFAIDIGANVVTQDDYLVKPELVEGFTVGILKSELANKVWRQSSFVASAIAQFIMNELGEDVIDNGDVAYFVNMLANAIAQVGSGGAAVGTARVFVSMTPPENPLNGQLWFDAASAQMFCWYDDGNSAQWVVCNTAPINYTPTPTSGVVFRTSTKTANYTITSNDSGTHFNNIGANLTTVLTLPDASAGLQYGGVIYAPYFLTFKAAGADRIRLGANTGTAGGFIRSNSVGASLVLEAHGASLWVVSSTVGSWSLDQ